MVDRELVRRSVAADDLDEFHERVERQAAFLKDEIRDESLDLHERVERQAAFLKDEIRDESLDNPDPTIGLEIEVYAVDEEYRLTDVPEDVFHDRFNKELGLHNAEINTAPDVLDGDGLASQREQIRRIAGDAAADVAAEGITIVFDSLWTIPPDGGSLDYLTDVDEESDLVLAEHMRNHPRYRAIDNAYVDRVGQVDVDVPGMHRSFPSILVESLATSIQPHLQVPRSERLPTFYNTAIRTMGPVLALATNSPLLAPDLYDDDVDPNELLDETYHELRIPVFEQAVNLPGDPERKKVRFPVDVDSAEDTVEKVVEDRTYSPFLREWTTEDDTESYTDEFWEFDFKRGTYWRWLRAVIGGEEVGRNDERSIRIEYRPIPTQPGVDDNVRMLALTAGLIVGLVEREHPLGELRWGEARQCFYDVVRDGLDAEMAWVDEDGTEIDETDAVYEEVFRYARHGLAHRDVPEHQIDELLEPIEARWRDRRTPSRWKLDEVRERMDGGDGFEEAVHGMQRRYIDLVRDEASFADWPGRR